MLKINKNPGILPVKQGQAFLESNEWSIIKTIKLEGIASDLYFNVQKYSEFCAKIMLYNNSHINDSIQLKVQVEYIRDEAIEKLQQLIPSKRFKRGLINPIGSLIKVITGNLDHEDAIHYDELITGLKTREQAISSKVTIISEMLDHVINSTKIMDENTRILNKRFTRIEELLKDASRRESKDFLMSHVISLLNLFINNFRTISMKLSDIETSLALSKLSVLHKAVLNSNELLKILQEISNFGHLMYTANEQNLINLEETLTVKTYVKDNEIRFIINVPLVHNVTYNYYKLYPLPVSSNPSSDIFVIIPEFPYMLVEGTKYRPIARKCRDITAKDFLCSENDLAIYTEETCIEQLMQYKQNLSMCSPRRIYSEDVKIQKIALNSWILFSKFEKILFQKCDDDVIQEQLQGTYLLTIQKPCNIFLDGKLIAGQRFHSLVPAYYKPVPIINLPQLRENEEKSIAAEPVNLKGVNLDDLQHLNFLLKNSVKSDNSAQVKSFGIATIVLYIIIAVIILLTVSYKCNSLVREKCCKRQEQPLNDVELNSGNNDRPLLLR